MDRWFILTAGLTGILWLCLALWRGWFRHDGPIYEEPNKSGLLGRDVRWYQDMNPGALAFSPVWLFANGFFVYSLLYVLLFMSIPLLAVVSSVALLFLGNRLSWAGGARWGYDIERFRDEQAFWSFIGIAQVVVLSFFLILGLMASM